MSLPVVDRLDALRRLTPEELGVLLGRVPGLTEALTRSWLPHTPDLGLDRLASVLGSASGIDLCLAALNRLELQLVMLAGWHGGTLRRDQAVAEAGRPLEGALEEAAGQVERLLLATRDDHWLQLLPGVLQVVGSPGARVRDGYAHASADTLGRILLVHGLRRLPPTRLDRLDVLEARLRDRHEVMALLDSAPDDAARIFDLLGEHGAQRVRDLGISSGAPWYRASAPLSWLAERGLVGVDHERQVAWVWLDVIVALNGGLFPSWPAPPAPPLLPLDDPGGTLPLVLSRVPALLDAWAAEPAPALASGGLGVRPVRAVAKQLGLPAGEAGLLAHLAIALGVVGRIVTVRRRGRQPDVQAWAPTDLAGQWREAPPARRWALLVQAWLQDRALDDGEGLPERSDPSGFDRYGPLAREAFLRLLARLPEGYGLDAAGLAAGADFEEPSLLEPARVEGITAAARVLGLVPATGPVGLTTLGRALLAGPDAVEAALPPAQDRFTVQADHTVITPPDLAPDLIAELERYADLESAAGARIYRLSERRIASAMDDDATAGEIVAFLDRHSTVPVAQNLTHLVHDVERRHGRLRAGAVGAYVRADDPALLTSALTVKAAKLRLLAPTVAVSPLTPDRLLAALRARGLMPVAEGPDGATLRPVHEVAKTPGHTLPEIRALGVLPDQAALEALAKTLLEHAP